MKNPNASAFQYCPSCGQKELYPENAKAFSCRACGFLFFINCAAAAMALIRDASGRLLVTCRRYDPGKGGLDLPGGFAEPFEGIEEALVREIKEELSLDVQSLTYFTSCFNAYPFGPVTYPVTDMAFFCGVKDFSTLSPADDVAQAFFMEIDALDPEKFAMDSARRVIRKFKAREESSL